MEWTLEEVAVCTGLKEQVAGAMSESIGPALQRMVSAQANMEAGNKVAFLGGLGGGR